MTDVPKGDGYHAGRLLQFGLRFKVIPFNEPEYKELVDRFIDRPQFRAVVREIAEGLGLVVLDVNDRGLFLGTVAESAFALKPSSFRGNRTSADDRLLDGLVQVAIAATIYPRQQDLDERTIEAKPPITCREVDELLRTLCSEFKQKQTEDPGAATTDMQRGLQEAWRVYESRPAVRTTSQGVLALNSTQGLIRRHLQELVEHGCFVAIGDEATEAFRPTLRYQVLVKELASTALFRQVQSLLGSGGAAPCSARSEAGGTHA